MAQKPENDSAAGPSTKLEGLQEGIDYTIDADSGYMIFTFSYLTKRGYCCESACRNCPYGFTNPDERK